MMTPNKRVECNGDYLLQPSECSGDLCQGCIILHQEVRGTGQSCVTHHRRSCSLPLSVGQRKNDHTDDFLSPAQILSMIADGPSWHLGCAEPCAACVRWLVLRSGQAITLRNTATTRITTLSLGAINQAKHCIVHSNKIMRQYRFAIFYLDKNLPKHVHLDLKT